MANLRAGEDDDGSWYVDVTNLRIWWEEKTMLTNCGCLADSEQTKILKPCLLHALWAKEYAATVFAERVAKADAAAGKGAR